MTKQLEMVEDDIQAIIDDFLEKLTNVVGKEGKILKEERLRSVCVEHSDVDASDIKKIYRKHLKKTFEKEMPHYKEQWLKLLQLD